MTVKRLFEEMDSEEFDDWLAYDEIEPLPDAYWCNAQLCTVIRRTAGIKADMKDFFPQKGSQKPPATDRSFEKYMEFLCSRDRRSK